MCLQNVWVLNVPINPGVFTRLLVLANRFSHKNFYFLFLHLNVTRATTRLTPSFYDLRLFFTLHTKRVLPLILFRPTLLVRFSQKTEQSVLFSDKSLDLICS